MNRKHFARFLFINLIFSSTLAMAMSGQQGDRPFPLLKCKLYQIHKRENYFAPATAKNKFIGHIGFLDPSNLRYGFCSDLNWKKECSSYHVKEWATHSYNRSNQGVIEQDLNKWINFPLQFDMQADYPGISYFIASFQKLPTEKTALAGIVSYVSPNGEIFEDRDEARFKVICEEE